MKEVCVHDSFQSDYTYSLTAPIGRSFDSLFTPDLTPKEMFELGVFDGWYFRGEYEEFPKTWFAHARLAPDGPDKTLNHFKVHASQPLSVWFAKEWIHPDDPRGWFQWYCRYYMGRRLPLEDVRQIKRWRAMKRHIAQVVHHCEKGDMMCRRRQRQALLHWAYDSRV